MRYQTMNQTVNQTVKRAGKLLAGVMMLLPAMGHQALAAPPPISLPVPDDSDGAAHNKGAFDFLKNYRRDQALLGDMWGLRTDLAHHGITFAIQETSEVLGNVTGGTRKGFAYDGLTQAVVQVNSQKAFGYYGGTFNVSALHVHGVNLSDNNLSTYQTASGIEARPGIRLWEVWYDQKFLPEDRLDIRIGQQSLDQEWLVSSNALLFVNTMFGWPMLPSADMPGGGPAYPLSAPGARVHYIVRQGLDLQLGAFSSSPFTMSNVQAQTSGIDPGLADPSGTSFPFFRHGALLLAELQYTSPALGGMVMPGGKQPLARTYKLGVWYDSERFNDLLHGTDGLPLAALTSNGIPTTHRGDLSVYGVADQMIWRSAKDPNRTLNAFARVMGTPFANRNLITYSANLGLVLHDPFPYRTADSLGIGMGWARISPQQAALDSAIAAYQGVFTPRQTSETYIEATYQHQFTPWLQLQPDIQYVFNPGGGVPNDAGTRRIGNEVVLGIRANIAI